MTSWEMDMQSSAALLDRIQGMIRRAEIFGHSKDIILDELGRFEQDVQKYMDRLEDRMTEEFEK